MELELALKYVYDGRALLFLGAGFSRGATNLSGTDFSLGTNLGAALASEAGLPTGLAWRTRPNFTSKRSACSG